MDNQKKPIIGKFVIENLTTGMYSDSRSVYREYVQNSADSIDKAITQRLIGEKDGEIHIEIDEFSKKILFQDNGTGVSVDKVQDLLQDVAQSEKELGKDKGFRGIGRLGGLAYCEKLIFETSFSGEDRKSIMVWDAKRLRDTLADREKKQAADDLIMAVTSFETKPEKVDEHYFRVTMSGVSNPTLLNLSVIRDYLRFTAPVPFDSSFIFRSKIYEEMYKDGVKIDEYNLFVNAERIYKGYKTFLYKDNNGVPTKIGEVKDVNIFKEYSKDNKILFWGWHSVSDIQNLHLTKINKGRGLRLRKHNIQIGDEFRLERLFKDPRYNRYVLGEIYAFDPDLIPNGRRDDFEANSVYNELQEKLKPICVEIDRLCNRASDIHSAKRKIDAFYELKQSVDEKQKNGVTNRDDLIKLETELRQKKEVAEKAEKTLNKFKEIASTDTETPIAKIFKETVKNEIPKVYEAKIEIDYKKPIFRTDKLSKLDRSQRKLMSEVYAIIQSVLSPDLSENLIKKIEENFK
ncbi:MAG: ATP-binding protein [Pyrinomonadaceae bacterium]|nr:ATP-binding protein [Pyrinomonadaceae bacterium]